MEAAKNGDEAPPAPVRGEEEADTDPDPRGEEAGGVRGTGGSVAAAVMSQGQVMDDVGIYPERDSVYGEKCMSLHEAMRWKMQCMCFCLCLCIRVSV